MASESSAAAPSTAVSPVTEGEIPLTVKYSGKEYTVKVCGEDTVGELKSRICEVTNVLPKRQKLLYPIVGANLSDDSTLLSQLSLKSSLKMVMIGTVEDDISVDQVDSTGTMDVSELGQNELVDIKDKVVKKQKFQRHIEQYKVMVETESTLKGDGNSSYSQYNFRDSTSNGMASPEVYQIEIDELRQERSKLLATVQELMKNLEEEKVSVKELTNNVVDANKRIEFLQQQRQKERQRLVGAMTRFDRMQQALDTRLQVLQNGVQSLQVNLEAHQVAVNALMAPLFQQVAQAEVGQEEQLMEVDREGEHPMEGDLGDGEVVDLEVQKHVRIL